MNLILIISITIRLAAMCWSIILLRRIRDWRIGFMTVMIGLMTLRQILTLLKIKTSWAVSSTAQPVELSGLAVSISAFLFIFSLERIITERRRTKEKLQKRKDENTRLAVIAKERCELQKWINTFDTFVGKFDPKGIGLFFNEAPMKAGGLTKDDVVGKHFPDTKWWSHSEIERDRIVECLKKAKAGMSSRIETNFRSADGTPIPIIFNCQPVMDDDGKVECITAEGKIIVEEIRLRTRLQRAKESLEIRVKECTTELVEANERLRQEIIERRQAENHIQHLQGVLKAIRNVNQLIVHEKNEKKLLQGACETLNQTRNYKLVWIGLVEKGTKNVLPVVKAGFDENYLKSIKITWDDSEIGKGPTGTAIKTRKPFVMRDIAVDPRYKPWREEAMKRGYASSAAIPLVYENRVFGALNVYADVPDFFDEEETELLLEVSQDIACALHNIEVEEKRKRAEDVLRESEEKYRQLVTTTSDAVIVFDVNTRKILEVNKACEKLYGYSKDEFLDLHLNDITAEPEKTDDSISKTLEGRLERISLRYHKKKDGTVFPVEISTGSFRIKGQILLCGIIRDITERRKAEQKLRDAYQKLKDTQEQLIQTGKMTAIGQLAAGISHELNQPLTGIKGFAQTILMDLEKDNPLVKDLERIVTQSDRMDKIIKHVRLFARKSEFEMKEVDISQPVEDALSLLTEQLRVHNIRVKKSLSRKLPKTHGDPNQLEQVFLNFLTNARDAINSLKRREGGEITITTALSNDKEHIEIIFKDTGCGIHKKGLNHIFNPFYTTKSPDGGVGLGLSIVYRIIVNHKGSIEVDSEEGKGTMFKIILPVI